MTRNLGWRRPIMLLAIIAIAVGVYAGTTLGLSSDPESAGIRRAEDLGAAAGQANGQPILLVNGVTVWESDLAELLVGVRTNREFMRTFIPEIEDPAARMDTEDRLALIEAHGDDAVALASVILTAAKEAVARREGHTPEVSEVSEAVANLRQQIEAAPDNDDASGFDAAQAYIEAIGEERYWNEIAPRQQQRNLAIGNLRATLGGETRQERLLAWAQFQKQLIAELRITVPGQSEISSDQIARALDYLGVFLDREESLNLQDPIPLGAEDN